MTKSHGQTVAKPKRSHTRAFFILFAVGLAVAIPILPLRFLGIPGPDFPDVSQVVTTSKNWLSKVTSGIEMLEPERPRLQATGTSTAEQVRMLQAAADSLNADLQRSPADSSLHNRLGLIYLNLGDTAKSSEHFQKAITLARLGIKTLDDRLLTLKQAGRTKDAPAVLLDISKLNVELAAAHSNLARVYERRGEHDKVIAELDMLNKEGILFQNNQSTVASDDRKLEPGTARNLSQADSLMQARQLPQAAALYKQVLAADPKIAKAHHRLGIINVMMNNTLAGMEELQMAAKLKPDSAEILADLGWAYQAMGQMEYAVKSYQESLAINPRQSESAINLSNVLAGGGKTEDAVKVLTQAARANPSSAKIHNNLGTLLSLDGKMDAARYEFERAVALAPDMASAHYGLGTVLMQKKSYMPAITEFKQAMALQPNMVQAQARIDEAHRKAGMSIGSAQALN